VNGKETSVLDPSSLGPRELALQASIPFVLLLNKVVRRKYLLASFLK